MTDTITGTAASADTRPPKIASKIPISLSRIELALGALAILIGIAASVKLLGRAISFDEFFTLAMTEPTQSFGQFYDLLKVDAHPFLYFIIVWFERALGFDGIAAMRSVNLIGLGVVAWAIWFAMKKEALTLPQAIALAAICVTSNVFLDAVAELRPYYLVACLTTAVALVYCVLWARLEKNEALTRGLLTAWALTVGVTASLNYFAMMICGSMAAALLIFAVLRRNIGGATMLGLVSLAAVVPALVNLAIQAPHQPRHFWIETTPKEALEMFIQTWQAIILTNFAVCASFAVTAIAMIESRKARDLHRAAMALGAATLAFYVLLFAINMVKPVIIVRYLTAAIGPTLVTLVLLGVGRHAPRWTLVAVTVCAILSGGLAVVTSKHERDGWDRSAKEVANRIAGCPSAKVYVRAENAINEELEILSNAARVWGYEYYGRQLGLPIVPLGEGGMAPAGEACPNILLVEHAFHEHDNGYDLAQVLSYNKVVTNGPATLEYFGNSAIVTLGAPTK